MARFLAEKSHKDFTPYIALVRAALTVSKLETQLEKWSLFRSPHLGQHVLEKTLETLRGTFRMMASWGSRAYLEDSSKTARLLDQLQSLIPEVILFHSPQIWREIRTSRSLTLLADRFIETNGDIATVSSMMFRHSLLTGPMSLISKLEHDPGYLRGHCFSPLLELVYRFSGLHEPPIAEAFFRDALPLVQLLLELGYDPNEHCALMYELGRSRAGIVQNESAWTELVCNISEWLRGAASRQWISLFLRFHADPNTIVKIWDGNNPGEVTKRCLPSWVRVLLALFCADGLAIEPKEYLGILRTILDAGSDLALLMGKPDPSLYAHLHDNINPPRGLPNQRSGWDILTNCLRSFAAHIVDQDGSISQKQLELTSGALTELARAGRTQHLPLGCDQDAAPGDLPGRASGKSL